MNLLLTINNESVDKKKHERSGKGELFNMARAWDKEKKSSPNRNDEKSKTTARLTQRDIFKTTAHRTGALSTEVRELKEKGHLTEFIYDRPPAHC